MCESEGGSFLATPVKVVGGVLLAAAAVSAAGELLAAVGGFLAHVAWLLAAGGLVAFVVPAVVLRWLGKRLTLVRGPSGQAWAGRGSRTGLEPATSDPRDSLPLQRRSPTRRLIPVRPPASLSQGTPPAIEPARVIPPPGWTLDGHRLPVNVVPVRGRVEA